MKQKTQGSILIWTMFLMFFVLSSFFYMSLQIKTKIQDQSKISQNSQEDVEKQILFTNNFSGALLKNETLIFTFENPNAGSIKVGSGGGIYFENGAISNGIIAAGETQNLTFSGTLSLKNLSGYSSVFLNFNSASGVTFPYNYYKTTKNIGGTSVVQSFGKLK